MKELWICGVYKSNRSDGAVWDFQGVFDSKELAIKACIDSTYFIAPCILNEILPEEQEDWKGCYYPLEEIK